MNTDKPIFKNIAYKEDNIIKYEILMKGFHLELQWSNFIPIFDKIPFVVIMNLEGKEIIHYSLAILNPGKMMIGFEGIFTDITIILNFNI